MVNGTVPVAPDFTVNVVVVGVSVKSPVSMKENELLDPAKVASPEYTAVTV